MSNKIKLKIKKFIPTLKLAIPLITILISQIGMEFTETIMVGKIGIIHLAAMAISGSIYITIIILCIGILTSIGVLISHEIGKNNYKFIEKHLFHGFLLSIILSIPTISLVWYMPYVLYLIGENQQIIELSEIYLHSIIWGIPGFLGFITLKEYTTAIKYPNIIMWISLIALPINACLNYLFIYGFSYFEPLGISGAGYASAIIEWIMFLSISSIIIVKKKLKIFIFFKKKIQLPIIKEMLNIGWPVGIMFGCEIGLFSVIAIIMGRFGTHTLAAHQIAIQISNLSFIFFLGIAQATGIKVAQAAGKKDINEINNSTKIGIEINLIIAIIFTFVLYLFPKNITNIFVNTNISTNKDILFLTIDFIHIVAIYQIFDALQAITNSSLRGLKDTFSPMWIGMLSYWIIGLSCGFISSYFFNLKGKGLWIGLTIGIIIFNILLLSRFYKKLTK
ncbi:MAG: MATE family efflux transporter [Candidatus Azosocius agrarius]|nr:MAG: MATE family efflux transporter [Gammaproteobacteria bacterium]